MHGTHKFTDTNEVAFHVFDNGTWIVSYNSNHVDFNSSEVEWKQKKEKMQIVEIQWTLPSGSKGKYIGLTKNGKPCGWGQFKYAGKDETYEGEYDNNSLMIGFHKLMQGSTFHSYHSFEKGTYKDAVKKDSPLFSSIEKAFDDAKLKFYS